MISRVIFDLDDTLFSERQFVESGIRAVHEWQLPRLGLQHFQEKAMALHRGPTRDRLLNRAFAACGFPATTDVITEAVRVFREHRPTLTLHEDAEWLLNHLFGRKRLGVISDGYITPQSNKVEVLGLTRFFEHIVYCESFGREFWRPHPLPFQKMMELMGGTPTEFVYVADNPLRDFIAPKAIGWHTVHIERPANIYFGIEASPQARAHEVIISLRDLAEI